MSKPYEFYLRGSDTYFDATNSFGVCGMGASDSAPTTMAGPPHTTTGWITIEVYGADMELTNEGSEFLSPSSQVYKDSLPRWTTTLRTRRYRFPDDWSDWVELQKHVSRPYLYIYQKTYDVTAHGVGASPVVCEYCVEHDYTYGKSMTLNLKRRVYMEDI